MLAVTHSELLLRDHCISRDTLNSKRTIVYLPALPTLILALCFELFLDLRGKVEKILYYTPFLRHFVTLVCLKHSSLSSSRSKKRVRQNGVL
jgi:hypothetical protein